MLDGAAQIRMSSPAAADRQPAVGLTDHGVLYGAVDFYQQATTAGLTPVIGMEGYLTAGSRFDRPPRRDEVRYHITLLAVTQEGYANLVKLASTAFLEGFYYKPRMDHELLARYAAGLVATTGCLGGHVPQLLAPEASGEEGNVGVQRDYAAAREAAAMYQDVFGKDSFFVEVMDHRGGAASRAARPAPDLPGHRRAPPGHQRLPLHTGVGIGDTRRTAVHPDRLHDVGSHPLRLSGERVLREDRTGDARPVPR